MRRLTSKLDLDALFVAVFALLGFRLGAQSIADNSMLLHLRTGAEIVDDNRIPREDIYSATAKGTEWVVQSWFPSWTYGLFNRVGDLHLVVLEQALLMALIAGLIAYLARTGSPLRTCLSAGLALLVGLHTWAPRPLLFGLLAFVLVVLIVVKDKREWLLLPVAYLWVQSHGSFPLGLVWLALYFVGSSLDQRAWDRRVLKGIAWFSVGALATALWPLGIKLVTFPLRLGDRREIFAWVTEWQSPDFQSPPAFVALVATAGALLVLMSRSQPWRVRVTVLGFLALSLYSVRNFAVFGVALAPALGMTLRKRPQTSTETSAREPSRLDYGFAAFLAIVALLFALEIYARPAVETTAFPVKAVEYMEKNELLAADGKKLVHQDVVGDYLAFVYGDEAGVFIDDRFDMYPPRISRDFKALLSGAKDADEILRRYDADVVLWDDDLALTQTLRRNSDTWRVRYDRGDWVVFERRS